MDQLVSTPLWPHQAEQVARLEEEPRILNGWQMGTGKTLFAVERDLRLRLAEYHGPTLVVAPMNTHESWATTFKNNTDLRVRVVDRKARERLVRNNHKYGDADVYIVHYDVLRLMPELINFFGHGIFDECHKLKSRGTKQTKAAKKLGIPFLTDMSGSPVTDRPQDIWSVLNHLKPKTYSSYWKFYHRYVDYEILYPQSYHKVLGPSDAWLREGLPNLKEFFTRVLKEDVLPDLPPKTYTQVHVDLTPQQRKQYEEMKRDMLTWLENNWYTDDEPEPLAARAVIAQLQRLQMFALGTAYFNSVGKLVLQDPSSKVDAVMEILEDNPDEQFVIFTNFKGPLRILRERFDKIGITYGSFTGDDSQPRREAAKRAFIEGRKRCLLGTISSGGVGVDGLQHASCNVIFLDRNWSPAVNEQAEDRLHRGGQTRTVQVIDVIARDTVDGGRLQRLELKKSWIKKMLGDGL